MGPRLISVEALLATFGFYSGQAKLASEVPESSESKRTAQASDSPCQARLSSSDGIRQQKQEPAPFWAISQLSREVLVFAIIFLAFNGFRLALLRSWLAPRCRRWSRLPRTLDAEQADD